MEEYYRNIINELKKDDTIDTIEELVKYVRDNNFDSAEDDIEELDILSMVNCSNTFLLFTLPTPMGTNFFSLFTPLQAANVIIPDIFRLCIIKEPSSYGSIAQSTRSFPKLRITYEDESLGLGAFTLTRFQTLIPENIIKAFLYFGYSSNFENTNINDIDFLEKKIANIINTSTSTSSSYTDPNIIFNEIYGDNSLIQNMVQLHNILEKVKTEKTDFTNIGNFNLPYLFSYYMILDVGIGFKFNPFNFSNFRDQKTTALSYSDLVYLNFVKKLIKDDLTLDNFILLLNQNILGEKIDENVIDSLQKAVVFIKNNNIFNIIDYAFQVKQYILKVISYNLNKKTYKLEKYAKPVYFLISKKIYCNYAKNSSFNYNELEVPQFCY